MMAVKIVTIINWVIIVALGVLLLLEALSPSKGGGDAAGRGIGQAILFLAIIAFVVLLILNLLPYNWSKFLALGLVVVPFIFFQIFPLYQDTRTKVDTEAEDAKPIFPDKERDQLARAFRDGDTELFQKLLQAPPANLNEKGELLAFAINDATSTSYKPEEKLECVRLLFQAGARLDSVDAGQDVPCHSFVADVGNAKLMRLLLEHGADANAVQVNFKKHILFAAILSYQQPEETVRALLESGANPNVTAVDDDEIGPESPLVYAARVGRWGVCAALVEKGADIHFKTQTGQSLQTYMAEVSADFSGDGYSKAEDLERLKKVLKGR